MASPSEIRHHIAAVEQTKKITGAMELVSSTRMKRVMRHIEHNRRYFHSVQRTMKELLVTAHDVSHPYLCDTCGEAEHHCTFIIISGDKGLCGAYNHNILQLAYDSIAQYKRHSIITIGNTAEEFFRKQDMTPDIALLGIAQDPSLSKARVLVREVMELFDSGHTEEVRIVYTSFYGNTKNLPVVRRLLPILLDDYSDIANIEMLPAMTYHPSPQEVFDLLVPQYILGILFGVMVQAYASEHFARMNAMHSATTNAQDMLKSLRIKYNMARQQDITNEIAEITGAAEILRQESV